MGHILFDAIEGNQGARSPTLRQGAPDHVRGRRRCTDRPRCIYVARVLHGGTDDDLLALLKRRFAKVQHFKPPASRKDSAEMFVVATGFRG